MNRMPGSNTQRVVAVAVVTAIVYFFSNPKPQFYYDYTFRVAERLLNGSLGLNERPPT